MDSVRPLIVVELDENIQTSSLSEKSIDDVKLRFAKLIVRFLLALLEHNRVLLFNHEEKRFQEFQTASLSHGVMRASNEHSRAADVIPWDYAGTREPAMP